MNLSGDLWIPAGVFATLLTAIIGVALWARDKPRLSVRAEKQSVFPGYGLIREGSYATLHPPPPNTVPHQSLVATVKNGSTVDLKVSHAGISLYGKNTSVNLDPRDAADAHLSLQLPVNVPTRDSIKFVLDVDYLNRLLTVLHAEPQDRFRFWVAEPMEKPYFSKALQASDYLDESEPLHISIHHNPQVVVEQIGEEEYNPEGWFPNESLPQADNN
jgi:hypothetical protein